MHLRLKLLSLLLLCTVAPQVRAKHVNPQTALVVAKTFMTGRYGISGWEMRKTQPYAHLYLVGGSDGRGFVVVAADDRIAPIIAYSSRGCIGDEIPASVDSWLSDYERQIEFLFSKDAAATPAIASEWEALANSEMLYDVSDVVAPLLTTTWSQSPYYNESCPGGAVTGCAATAMAQVMKFWNHPFVGVGQHSYPHATYGTLSANFSSTYYDWGNMPGSLSASSNTAQKYAVSTLMYHCGVSINMNYGTDASGGSVIANGSSRNCVENALKDYFDYKESVRGLKRDRYTDSAWYSMIKVELQSGRPLLYVGRPNIAGEGGHAFVLDGVDNTNRFHINWGWGGLHDGYWLLDLLHPYPNVPTYDFSYDQYSLFGIEPNSTVLKTTPTHLAMSVGAGTDTLWVRSNPQTAGQWTAHADQPWVHLSRSTGPGSGQQTMLLVSADANPSGGQRTANITFAQGAESFTVRLLQSDGSHSTSDWFGSEVTNAIFFIRPNQEYFIRPEAFGTFQQGSQLTKVKFNIFDDARNSGDMMTIRIYEDNSLPSGRYAPRDQHLGQVVYTQTHPIPRPGIHEVVLNTPYIVTDKNFWVSIQPSDSVVLRMGKDYIPDTIPESQCNHPARLSGAYLSAGDHWLTKMHGFDRLASDTTRGRQYNWMNAISVYVNTDTRYSLQVQTSSLYMGSVNDIGGEYPNMSPLGLTATAFPGYRFMQWSDGVTDNPRTVLLWKDSTIVAMFEPDRYALQLTPSPSAHGSAVGAGLHPAGSVVQFGAIPHSGYVFTHWSDGNNNNPRQIVINSDTAFTACFSPLLPDTLILHDTTYITRTDTLTVVRTDTLTIFNTDTVIITQHDTLTILLTDTLYLHDTLYLTDTLYITNTVRDTIYITDTVYVGVDDVETVDVKLYQQGGDVVVEGAEGHPVAVYDAVGRLLTTRRDTYGPVRFAAPAAGTYLVRVGSAAARRIVVVR